MIPILHVGEAVEPEDYNTQAIKTRVTEGCKEINYEYLGCVVCCSECRHG